MMDCTSYKLEVVHYFFVSGSKSGCYNKNRKYTDRELHQ